MWPERRAREGKIPVYCKGYQIWGVWAPRCNMTQDCLIEWILNVSGINPTPKERDTGNRSQETLNYLIPCLLLASSCFIKSSEGSTPCISPFFATSVHAGKGFPTIHRLAPSTIVTTEVACLASKKEAQPVYKVVAAHNRAEKTWHTQHSHSLKFRRNIRYPPFENHLVSFPCQTPYPSVSRRFLPNLAFQSHYNLSIFVPSDSLPLSGIRSIVGF